MHKPAGGRRPVAAIAVLALVAVAAPLAATSAAADPTSGAPHPVRSADLPPAAVWGFGFPVAGTANYHCHQHPGMLGVVEVRDGAPQQATVDIQDFRFVPDIVAVAPGGTVTWTNRGNVTHSVAFTDVPLAAAGPSPFSGVVAAFLFAGAALSGVLIAFALRAYRHNRDPNMAFVASAFTLFLLKDGLVAYSVQTGLIAHNALELVDAAGDLGTVLLLVMPLFWPRGQTT